MLFSRFPTIIFFIHFQTTTLPTAASPSSPSACTATRAASPSPPSTTAAEASATAAGPFGPRETWGGGGLGQQGGGSRRMGAIEFLLYNMASMLAGVAAGYDVRLSNVSPMHPKLHPNR